LPRKALIRAGKTSQTAGTLYAIFPKKPWKKSLAYNRKAVMAGLVYDCFTFFNELDLLEIRLNVYVN
jgi:hypothetical protein